MAKQRKAEIKRDTTETKISLAVNLDGTGTAAVKTSVGFLDHMLELFSKHSLIDLTITASGDTHVDFHHTVEDVGICLGGAIKEALGDKKGIKRFGQAAVPMEEALAEAVVDLSGRPFLVIDGEVPTGKIGEFDSELFSEFMQAFANNLQFNLHIEIKRGRNAHHIMEASFKALAQAMKAAVQIDDRVKGVPSTKGVL